MKTDCARAVLAMRPSDKIDLYILDSGDGYFLRIVKVVVVVKRIGYEMCFKSVENCWYII